MAIVTISRQLASLGDEVCGIVARKLNYSLYGKRELEQKIVRLGFPQEKLKKYDEKLPGFFASLSRDRDEYLDYLQTAILELAQTNNCIFIGRGSFIILSELSNHLSFRIVSPHDLRLERLVQQNVELKAAEKQIQFSDKQRLGFHKSFFNYNIEDPSLYHAVLNTGLFNAEQTADLIVNTVNSTISPDSEHGSMRRLEQMLICQRIVNMLVLDYDLNINFMHATASGQKITLHGYADSALTAEQALIIAKAELPDYRVESAISVALEY